MSEIDNDALPAQAKSEIGFQEGETSDAEQLLSNIQTGIVAAKMVFASVPEKNQVEFLQAILQGLMEVLEERGTQVDAVDFGEAVIGLHGIVVKYP